MCIENKINLSFAQECILWEQEEEKRSNLGDGSDYLVDKIFLEQEDKKAKKRTKKSK